MKKGKKVVYVWKKITTIILAALCSNLIVSISSYAEENTYDDIIKDIAPYVYENETASISRGDCVATIVKLVGVDEEVANIYTNALYENPIFWDLDNDLNKGYIIIAAFNGITNGVSSDPHGPDYFAAKKEVTVKQCLTFMLRCLTDTELVLWDNIMEDSVKFNLLEENELGYYDADSSLTNKQFYTLLYRMLDKNRYLYWPENYRALGYDSPMSVDMEIDQTNSIKYVDWWIKKAESF